MTAQGYGDDDYGIGYDPDAEAFGARPPRTPRERRMLKRSVRRSRPKPGALAVVLLVIGVVIGGPAVWMWWQIDPPTPQGDAVTVTVNPGSGTAQIGSVLESANVIGSAWAFEVYIAASGA